MKTNQLTLVEHINKLSPDEMLRTLFDYDGACGVTDFAHTNLRLWQVFSALYEQGTIDSNDNPNSTFNRALHGGLPPADYTPQYAIEWALGLGVIVPLLLGFLGKYRHLQYDRTIASKKYQVEQINPSIQRPNKAKNDMLQPEAIVSHGFRYFFEKTKITHHAVIPPAPIEQKPSFISQIGSQAHHIWNELLNFSTLFWPVWMSTMLLVGSTAIGAAPVMPIMMGVVITSCIAYMGYAYWSRRKRAEIVTDESAVNRQIIHIKEIWQRRHMKEAHLAFKQSLRPVIQALNKDYAVTPQYQPLFKEDEFETLSDVSQKKLLINKFLPAKGKKLTEHALNKIQEDELTQYLFGSPRKQRVHTALTIIMNFIGQLAGAFFALWFMSSTLSAVALVLPVGHLAIPLITSGADILGSNILGSILGSLIGLITSYQLFHKHQASQKAFQDDVISTLSSSYERKSAPPVSKNSPVNRHHKTVLAQFQRYDHSSLKDTKFDRFKTLQAGISYYKNLLKATQDDLRKVPDHRLTPLQKAQLAYDLSKVDVYNRDYYFAKQKEPSRMTSLMKGVMRLYNLLYGAQTGFFISRMFFLSGGVAASACLAYGSWALVAFAVVAGVLAVAVGSMRTTRYHLDRDHYYKEKFIESFDAKLSYMSKKFKEMYYLFPEKADSAKNFSAKDTNDSLRNNALPTASFVLNGAARNDNASSDNNFPPPVENAAGNGGGNLALDNTKTTENDRSDNSSDDETRPLLGSRRGYPITGQKPRIQQGR